MFGLKVEVMPVQGKFVVRVRKTFFGYAIRRSTVFVDDSMCDWKDPTRVAAYGIMELEQAADVKKRLLSIWDIKNG